ncbi:hydroxypyruvate isomerase family protein [Thalassococcus lentus]|uniref:TIM barrel protein n=1 Tax=Thalassococcus lentus TaxID=1210524 RepID=A0ABT4XPC1_9RHOB|nr:TIM barrel protein [Thalassococcus lentus]MDA7423752.1 TIM barrel protein [Thalassococcus lentus]
MKIAANLTMLFPDVPMEDRPQHAANLGFDGVECLLPYDQGAEAFKQRLDQSEMPLALINTPEPGWANGDRGRGAIPSEMSRFRREFEEALEFAHASKAQRLHVMAGLTQDDAAFDTFVENLRWATALSGELPLCIEPLNPIDMPGYFLNDYALARRVIDAVDAPNLGLQYDSWHAARIHGDPLKVWQDHAEAVTHVQIAGFEGRGAPNSNNAPEAELLKAIGKSSYNGWVSAEFVCQPDETAGWLNDVRACLEA